MNHQIIMINTIEKVKTFVSMIESYHINGFLSSMDHSSIIPAHSIMGIFSLDLTSPLLFEYTGTLPPQELAPFLTVLQKEEDYEI